ncbi:pirin family protein [Janthinobacterium sp.]|uniref:pirin family protein n=1 Tax=Janthinobacterium sp. TaxID=1871054 RepID=UPI00289F97A7|nr:pirin family protein [Janthinobacterium sp.]
MSIKTFFSPTPHSNPEPMGRQVAFRTKGRDHGGITRLVSPGDIGAMIKPFIFLDLFELHASRHKMGMHPHSGIATVTVILDGALAYRESTGAQGVLTKDNVEWMSAGGGIWHQGTPADASHALGFQLWLALPPEDENGASQSQYLSSEQVPQHGPARVVIGSHGEATSSIRPRASINYLHVRLAGGEVWKYTPPAGHDVAWIAVASGALRTGGTVIEREVAVFEAGEQAIEVIAQGPTEFVLGSAIKHPHELVSGMYSVHTSTTALEQGEREIIRLRDLLFAPHSA